MKLHMQINIISLIRIFLAKLHPVENNYQHSLNFNTCNSGRNINKTIMLVKVLCDQVAHLILNHKPSLHTFKEITVIGPVTLVF